MNYESYMELMGEHELQHVGPSIPNRVKTWEPETDGLINYLKSRKTRIYVIGSLRSPKVPLLAQGLRAEGYEVFDDWYAAGPEADDKWQIYEEHRGHSYAEALKGFAAEHVFHFDKRHLDLADVAVLVGPAGRSAHLELGYVIGRGKRGLIYLPDGEPERWDVMYRFAESVSYDFDGLLKNLDLGGI